MNSKFRQWGQTPGARLCQPWPNKMNWKCASVAQGTGKSMSAGSVADGQGFRQRWSGSPPKALPSQGVCSSPTDPEEPDFRSSVLPPKSCILTDPSERPFPLSSSAFRELQAKGPCAFVSSSGKSSPYYSLSHSPPNNLPPPHGY